MPNLVKTDSTTLLGYVFPRKSTVAFTDFVGATKEGDDAIAIAKIGQLTTRTDANTGTLTMAGGHGITTGQRLDLYWVISGVTHCQRGITVGTVSVNSVPFDLGVGANLPDNLTAITAMVPSENVFVVTGDDADAVAVYSSQIGTFTFCESDETEIFSVQVGGSSGTEQSYVWSTDDTATNPLAGGDITKVYFSHASSATAANMRAIVPFS